MLPLCLLVLGVSAAASREQSPAVKTSGAPTIGNQATITVLAKGAEPRTRLRYMAVRAYTDHMTLRMDQSVVMEMSSEAVLPLRLVSTRGADITVTDVQASGDISFAVTFTPIGLETGPGGVPSNDPKFQDLALAVQGVNGVIKSLTGNCTISDRGLPRWAQFDMSKVTDPMQRQILEPVVTAVKNVSTPLPEEAIGIGARWEVRRSPGDDNVQTPRKTVFKLAALEGHLMRLTATMDQPAPSAPFDGLDLPPGTEARVRKYDYSGSGTLTLRLDTLVPSSEISVRTHGVMDMKVRGGTHSASMTTTVKISVSPGK
jgi:hypothetical protein